MGRRYGQHFLIRPSILERIAAAACGTEVALPIVEIGPGKGALTTHLLPRAARVIAVEVDPVLVHYLRARFREQPKLEVIDNDVLHIDLSQWGRAIVCGNLPYYITSPIIEKTLALGPLLERAVFMVQKEVGERITAAPGTRDYGYLSVSSQLLAETALLFEVPAAAFRPPPKVDSAVVRFTPRVEMPVRDPAAFLKFASRAFQHKRKTLRNNLREHYDAARVDAMPESKQRAEQLGIAELVRVYSYLERGQPAESDRPPHS